MGNGEEVVVRVLIGLVFATITAVIAHSKGRNPVGWFFFGLFFSCLALIIVICLSNLKEEQAKWTANEIEQRRLREQLRQEQLKNEALRQHTMSRLDIHDEKLGIDTRETRTTLALGGSDQQSVPAIDPDVPPALKNPEPSWYFSEDGRQNGPVTIEEVQHRVAIGLITRTTLVWAKGMADWREASTIPEIFPS